MKAMILAAGRGERMKPLTDFKPKPLLPIAGKAMIEYHLQALLVAGIKEVVINHAYLGEQIEQHLGDGSQWGVSIRYSREDRPLETGAGIKKALPLLGDSPFLLVNGDIWTDYDFSALRHWHNQPSSLMHAVLVPNPEHNPKGDFCIGEQSRLMQCDSSGQNNAGQNNDFVNSATYSGIARMQAALFDTFDEDFFPLKPVIDRAILAGQATAELHAGQWVDVGTPERLQHVEQTLVKSVR